MNVSLIVAAAENGVIGRDNDLPWRLSADLRRFKALTMGHAVVMGRKTYESIGRPLPGRRMIVVTRQSDYAPPGVETAGSLDAALDRAADSGEQEAFIIGGAEIFAAAAPLASRVYLTRVHAAVDGDVHFHFPPPGEHGWRQTASERFDADDRNQYAYSFEVYERAAP